MTIDQSTESQLNKSVVMWNMIGSIIAAAGSFIFLIFTTKILGVTETALFSIAFSTGQVLLSVGKFGVRPYQATDVFNEFSFRTYVGSRAVYCLLMIGLCLLYCIITGLDLHDLIVYMLVCAVKMMDAVEDVYHGHLQKVGKLDLAGKMLALRNTITIVLFCGMLMITTDLVRTLAVTAIVSATFTIIPNQYAVANYKEEKSSFSISDFKSLTIQCTPLFVSSLLMLLIYNIPKYALDFMASPDAVTYYSIIFMPIFAINMLSEFIFKPIITGVAVMWGNKDFDSFIRQTRNLIAAVAVISVFAVVTAYLIGTQCLTWIFSLDVNSYKIDFTILVVAGGFSAGAYLIYNILTAVRMQKITTICYGITLAVVSLLSFVSAGRYGIRGVSISYLISEIVLFTIMLTSVVKAVNSEKKA